MIELVGLGWLVGLTELVELGGLVGLTELAELDGLFELDGLVELVETHAFLVRILGNVKLRLGEFGVALFRYHQKY